MASLNETKSKVSKILESTDAPAKYAVFAEADDKYFFLYYWTDSEELTQEALSGVDSSGVSGLSLGRKIGAPPSSSIFASLVDKSLTFVHKCTYEAEERGQKFLLHVTSVADDILAVHPKTNGWF